MPIVSIILPNYNHAPFLEERLHSIFNQTFKDFEVILLDDASTDDSVAIMNKYAEDNKVSHFVINKKNSGSPFKQWEKGLELAKGKYIWIAESDDSCELNFLESQLENIDLADVSVAKTVAIIKNKKTKRILSHPVFEKNNRELISEYHFKYNCPILNVSAIVFKNIEKGYLNKITFSKFSIIGDLMFYYEVFNKKQILYNENTVSYFRQSDKGISSIDTKDLKYFKSYFNEHVAFIKKISKQNDMISKDNKRLYIQRMFNKIRNRLSFIKKSSPVFLLIYLKYKYFTFIT